MVDDSTLWTVVAGGIYFVPNETHPSVQHYEFGTRRIREIFKVEREFGEASRYHLTADTSCIP